MDHEVAKSDLIQTVKTWVQLDNKIKQLSVMLKDLRKEKKSQNEKMIDIMKENNIDNFDLKDGQIQYKKYTKREALTQKKLLQILSTHPQLQQEQVQTLNEFVFDNRKVVTEDIIVRKTHK